MGHFSMEKSLNPGSVLGENQHAAISSLLLGAILLLYWLYDRLVGIDNVKLG